MVACRVARVVIALRYVIRAAGVIAVRVVVDGVRLGRRITQYANTVAKIVHRKFLIVSRNSKIFSTSQTVQAIILIIIRRRRRAMVKQNLDNNCTGDRFIIPDGSHVI